MGKCIEVARPYYEAQEKARLAQIECQAAAVQFQRANGKINIKYILQAKYISKNNNEKNIYAYFTLLYK